MQERFQKEQDFLAKERIKEKEARAEAYRKEQERIAKSEAARQETERILEAQQKLVEARKREMAARDAEREAKKIEKQRALVCIIGARGSDMGALHSAPVHVVVCMKMSVHQWPQSFLE